MAKARILLVQNVQTQSNSTRTYLEGLGFDVIWAGSGLTAMIAGRNAAMDLILLDVALPDMEGMDLCRRFRQREETKSIPIILIVGRGFSPVSFGSQEDKPDYYIEKPYTEKELNNRIFAALGAKKAAHSADAVTVTPGAPKLLSAPETKDDQKPAPAPQPAPKPVLKLVPKTVRTDQPAESPAEKGKGEIIDPTTGLFSRPQFEAMFSKSFKQCQRFKQQMSCMMIDLDGTKMGRKADTELIKEIIRLVQTTIREVDTAAWWTGESLVVLLPNTLRNDAVQAAARILENVANHQFTWSDATRVTMSIGVAGLPDSAIDSEQKLIAAAALASSKALDMMAPVPKSLDGILKNRKEPADQAAAGERANKKTS